MGCFHSKASSYEPIENERHSGSVVLGHLQERDKRKPESFASSTEKIHSDEEQQFVAPSKRGRASRTNTEQERVSLVTANAKGGREEALK